MLRTQKITIECTVSQSEGNIVSNMDGEKVMMNIEKGKYYNLGELGGIIWEIISSPVKIENIIEKLRTEYEVEKTTCEQQVLSFIQIIRSRRVSSNC